MGSTVEPALLVRESETEAKAEAEAEARLSGEERRPGLDPLIEVLDGLRVGADVEGAEEAPGEPDDAIDCERSAEEARVLVLGLIEARVLGSG